MKRYEFFDITSNERDRSMGLSYVDPISCATFWRRPPRSHGKPIRYLVRHLNYDEKIAYCVPYKDATPDEKATNLHVFGGKDIRPWD